MAYVGGNRGLFNEASDQRNLERNNKIRGNPPPGSIQNIPGYGGASFGQPFVQPLPPTFVPVMGVMPVVSGPSAGSLSPEEAKLAIIREANNNCCWGKGPATTCNITGVVPASELLVKVETYIETRNAFLCHRPFRGEPFMGWSAGFGTPPPIWQIQIPMQPMWNANIFLMEIPYTSYVVMCHECNGAGNIRCEGCEGRGSRECGGCGGGGKQGEEQCGSCNGGGRSNCGQCGASGNRQCPHCQGARELRFFMELEVKHQTLVHEQAVGAMANEVPPQILDQASGQLLVNFAAPGCPPITQGWAPEVCQASMAQLQASAQQTQQLHGWQHQQRLSVKAVSVFRCTAENTPGQPWNFYVVGDNKVVYAPQYPSQCCGCCTVM